MRRLGRQVALFRAALRNTLPRTGVMSEAASRAQSGPQVWSGAQRWILSLDLSFSPVAFAADIPFTMRSACYRYLRHEARRLPLLERLTSGRITEVCQDRIGRLARI